MSNIGFIGAGMMGHGMAANLIKGGHLLTVMAHRNRKPIEDLIAKGAKEAKSRSELAKGQDAICLCITGTPQVEETLQEIEPVLVSGQYLIDMGTSRPASSLAIAKRLAKRGIIFVDAPVGGGPQHAEAGELVSMVGASAAVFAHVLPWLKCTSKTVVRMGEVGAGAKAKLINNYISLGQSALVIEGYRLAREQGIDWQNMFDVNMGGAARSGTLERMIPPAIAGNFQGYLFSLANSAKDLDYYVEAIGKSGSAADTSIAAAIRDYFRVAAEAMGGDTVQSEMLNPQKK